MDRSCGNCAMVLDETERLVKCQPDLLPAVWHQKTDVCRSCEYFRPKYEELHLRMVCLRAEYYQGENKAPIAVIAECEGGRRFSVSSGKVGQVRLALAPGRYGKQTVGQQQVGLRGIVRRVGGHVAVGLHRVA